MNLKPTAIELKRRVDSLLEKYGAVGSVLGGSYGKFATKEGRTGKKDDKSKKSKESQKKDYSNMTEAQAIKEAKTQPKRNIDFVAKKFSKLIESKLEKYGAVDYVIGGSYAKGTFVDDGHGDIDVFVRFPTSLSDEEFKQKTLDMGNEVLKDYPRFRKFGQHPYTESFMNQTRLNLVGAFAIKKGEPVRSAADRSPFHVEHVSKFSKEKKNEIKKLKTLLKSINLYGADNKKQGFSGYASEILIDKYGTVDGVKEFFANNDKPFELIDPVDKNRKLHTAISQNTLDKLTLHARGITLPNKISTPSSSVDLGIIKNDNEDSQAGQRRKVLKKIIGKLERSGFSVLDSNVGNDGRVKINFESENIPKYQKQTGPELSNKIGSDAFIKAHENESVYTKSGRLYAVVERQFTNANDLIKSIMEQYKK